LDHVAVGTTYEGFANNSVTTFKTLLLDTNGTYIFTLTNSLGRPYFMQRNGRSHISTFNIADDTTYDFASNTFENQDT